MVKTSLDSRLRTLPGAAKLAIVLALIAIAVVLIVVIIRWAPHWLASTKGLSPADRVAEFGRVRTALLAVLAGTLAAIGAIYTARTFALNRRGQITDRFTRAVDQLGNEKLDVRLGGIYALERLARESRDDHAAIVEILTAYVREHAPWPPQDDATSDNERSEDSAGPAQSTKVGRGPTATPKPATDVQAVLTVLGRREVAYEGDSVVLDIRDTALSGAILVGAHLERAILGGAHLERAILVGAHLEHAELVRARLDGADLREARLEGTILGQAHLEAANLADAHLEGANLGGAHLEHAFLADARLEGAILGGAHLEHANLSSARLDGAYLQGTHLEDAGLGSAHLENAVLYQAHLEGADLSEAHLESATFVEVFDSSTTAWPTGFIPGDHGVVRPG